MINESGANVHSVSKAIENKNNNEQVIAEKAEKEATAAATVNSYSMRPAFGDVFPLSAVKTMMNSVLVEKLKGKTYNSDEAANWVCEISDEVNTKIKDASPGQQRYKHVVQVYIGQQLGAGCKYIARCCWDADSDTYVTDVFTSPSLYCICTVFAIYQY